MVQKSESPPGMLASAIGAASERTRRGSPVIEPVTGIEHGHEGEIFQWPTAPDREGDTTQWPEHLNREGTDAAPPAAGS